MTPRGLTRGCTSYRLRDHGRGSGTFVNGRPILWTRLTPGMRFTIGDTEFRLLSGGSVARSTMPGADLVVSGLTALTPDGQARVKRMSFTLGAGSVLAIVGPSGAGKSSLFRALLGELAVTSGQLSFRGLDLTTHGDQIRPMLGFVPQADELYATLRTRDLLKYGAMLRLATDAGPDHRQQRIREVCEELGITAQLSQRVDSLSGGQRKRVSIALELLARPSLLMLDEPTSGLDARRDREVMKTLRGVASEGCTVLVVTHSTDNLKEADRVLAVAPGGRPGYFEPPGRLLAASGTDDYADFMTQLSDEGTAVADAYERHTRARPPVSTPTTGAAPTRVRSVQPTVGHQLSVLGWRQLALLSARGWSGLLRPFILAGAGAALTCAVTSSQGLATAANPGAAQTVALLTTLCILTGQALTYNEVVGEFTAIRREHRTGTIASAVVLSKWFIFAIIAVAQAGLVATIFLFLRSAPPTNVLGSGGLELFVTLAATSVAAMSVGLFISVQSTNLEQAVGLATASAVCQVALNGVAFHVADRAWLNALSMLLPSRWGVGALASSIDLTAAFPPGDADTLWSHATGQYLVNLAVLTLMAGLALTGACLRLRRRLEQQPTG